MQVNTIYTSEGRSVIVITGEGIEPAMVTESHPNYLRIQQAVQNGDDPTEWLDASPAVIEKIVTNLSSRVSVVDGVLHFDGDPVYNGLASTIQRYNIEGRDAQNLVRFMERLSANPVPHSREQLFTWTEAQDLTIDVDGYIVGYRGVTSRSSDQDYLDDKGQPLFPLEQYPFASSTGGHGIVDGIEINGCLPQGVGVTVEMPRDEVNHNPSQGCSTGLHIGTHDYAKGYAHRGALLEVKFDPADVVSVPTECGWAKLRCCRYTVVAVHEQDYDDLSEHEPDAAWDAEAALGDVDLQIPEGWVKRLTARLRRKGAEA